MSMRETARSIGVPESTYREWEYGREIMGSEHYPRMAKTFEVTLEELFGIEAKSEDTIEQTIERIQRDTSKVRDAVEKTKKR